MFVTRDMCSRPPALNLAVVAPPNHLKLPQISARPSQHSPQASPSLSGLSFSSDDSPSPSSLSSRAESVALPRLSLNGNSPSLIPVATDYVSLEQRGNVLLLAQKYPETIRLCDKVLRELFDDNQTMPFIRMRAKAYYKTGQLEKAIEDYNFLIKRNPLSENLKKTIAKIYLDLIKIEFDNKNYEKVIILAKRASKCDEDQAKFYKYEGMAQFHKNRFYMALYAFKRAAEKGANDFDVWYYKGQIYLVNAKIPEATRCLLRALEFNKNDPKLLCLLGDAYLKVGNNQDEPARSDMLTASLTYFKAAFEADPHYLPLYKLRAGLYYSIKKDRHALKDINHYLQFNPREVDALIIRANINRVLGEIHQSLKDIETCLELDPNNASPLREKASLYISMGLLDEAQGLIDHLLLCHHTGRAARNLNQLLLTDLSAKRSAPTPTG